MDSDTESSLTARLESSDYRGLYQRFSSFLLPFADFIPLDYNKNPSKAAAKKKVHQQTTTKKKKKGENDPKLVRPLAKQFLPFLSRTLKLLPTLLRRRPKGGDGDGGGEVEEEKALELLRIYGLILDCLWCIHPCLEGKPYSVPLQRGRFVYFLEAWGRYAEAEEEAFSLLKTLHSVLVPATPVPKLQKGCFLPEPEVGSSDNPEIAILSVDVVVCLIGCAFKSKSTDAAAYERILALVEQLQPWLRVLDPEVYVKYQSFLVNALYKCSLFLAEEYMCFDGDLVRHFCVRMLKECLISSSKDHFPKIARKICSSIGSQCESRPLLILDMLRIALESTICGCKVDVVKSVNEFLEFVSYSADNFLAASMDLCKGASKLLYERGDDFLQVSPPVASILSLYAAGLYLKSSNAQAKQSDNTSGCSKDASATMLSFENEENLQNLNDSLCTLARYFQFANYKNEVFLNCEIRGSRDLSCLALESKKSGACRYLHGKASLFSYLDALEFLCKLLVEKVKTAWKYFISEKEAIYHSANINHVQDAFHQFCELILSALRGTKTSESDRARLHASRGALLQAAVSAFKTSLMTSGNYQASLDTINYVISSEWIEPQDLKFVITSLHNIGASLYNVRQLEQASIALVLCCETIWTHVKLLCRAFSDKPKGIHDDDLSEVEIKDVITDACAKSAMMLDVLHKCSAINLYEIVVKCLLNWSAAEDMLQKLTCSMVLVRQWVKIMWKDFEDVDKVDNAPVLYSLLLNYCSTWSKKTVGKILEQELLAYGEIEVRSPKLCQKMQLKVIDILLFDIYTTEDYHLQRSRVLVRKGRALRVCGIEGLSSCIRCLSEAISLLNGFSCDPSWDNASVYHQLAVTYCLRALCTQEANQDFEQITSDVGCALSLWSSIDIIGHCFKDDYLELEVENTMPLLCNVADLLSLKGYMHFHYDICKLIIMFCMRKNVPLEKCLAMLWSDRRLSHLLCTSPVDEDFIMSLSQQFEIPASSIDFWISCMRGYPSSLLGFLQKCLLCDSVLPEVSIYNSERSFGTKVAVDEVEKVASSLISTVPLASQSAFTAGYLYYDLSERLFSNGRLYEALSYAREALRLRSKILQRKFIYSVEQQSAKFLESGKTTPNSHEHVCLEAEGSVITEIWPDVSKSKNSEDPIISPWGVLKCYLESVLQVAIINESAGNGAEAVILLQTGIRISSLQDLPLFVTAFKTLLGQLYRKQRLWDLAENELNSAKKLLLENDAFISCKHCKLAFEVTIDMQIGDLTRDLSQNSSQIQSVKSLSHALCLYRSALEKLNHTKLEGSFSACENSNTISYSKIRMEEVKHGVLNTSGLPSMKQVSSTVCRVCSSSCNSGVHHDGPKQSDSGMVLPRIEGGRSNVNMGAKRRSRNPSKGLPAEHILNAEPKSRRTRSSSRYCDKETANITANFGCNEACICNRTKCWRCLLIEVMEVGSMQDIIFLKWECHRRRLSLRLLSKIARCLGIRSGNHEAHEVHEVFWQSIYLLFNRKPFCHTYSALPGSCWIDEFIGDESSGGIFCIESAAILYNMSLFLLKDCLSEHSRAICCCLADIQMENVVPWLLRAFILCRELPLLFQKISKLLASIFLLSTLGSPISLPLYSGKPLSISHWAAYFHQASLGNYLHCQYLSSVRETTRKTKASEDPHNAGVREAFDFLRFVPEKLEHLEELVGVFYQGLPNVPVICISMLGGDYVNLIGETLLLPSFFPAWMLLSRLDSIGQPIVMLLPVDFVLEEIQNEDKSSGYESGHDNKGSVRNWECPWSCSVVDYVAPSFKLLLEENYLSLSESASTPTDMQKFLISWWSHRTSLNNRLRNLLRNMEDSWLGPWGCLLLGGHSDPEYLGMVVTKLTGDLKFQYKFEVNENLVRAVLCGSKSVTDAEECISQLILYKGYFGRGACCGKERLRVFSTASHGVDSVSGMTHNLILEAVGELAEKQVDRGPVILVLDSDVQMLPWENLPVLRNQEVYRMPSVVSISITLNQSWHYRDQVKASGASFPSIDPLDVYYLLNPSGDLSDTQVLFEEWFRNQKWEGKAGNAPTTEELAVALQKHDLFLYFGHGNGTQYISQHEIQKLDRCAATLLMGCSSGSLSCKGCYAPQGAPLSYLFAGSPAVIANLWDVSDKDIDRFGKAMLNSWLQAELVPPLAICSRCNRLVKEFGSMKINDEGNATFPKTRRKARRDTTKLQQSFDDKSKCNCCGEGRRIASSMSQARDACRLPFLIGASPVCYGVPTVIKNS